MQFPSLTSKTRKAIVFLCLSILDTTVGLTFTSSLSSFSTSFVCGQQPVQHYAPNHNSNNNNILSMKVSKGKSKQARSKGSQIALKNDARIKAAGKKGTKSFVDPNKVFVGNLSYNATESNLRHFFTKTGGIPEANIEAIKIIRDWKTGTSKGYGFVQFMSPIYATSAMELLKGQRLMGRIVRLDQGKKKKDDPIVVVKQKRESPKDLEEEVIGNALEEAEQSKQYHEMDVQEQQDILEEGLFMEEYDDATLFEDDDDFEDEDEDDDFQYDGVYVEEYLSEDEDENADPNKAPMNREKRRDAAKKNKKRRKPGRGFGNI